MQRKTEYWEVRLFDEHGKFKEHEIAKALSEIWAEIRRLQEKNRNM